MRFRADRARDHRAGRQLARFVLDNQVTIGAADIEPPEELHDRAADNWRPLMAIGEVAGGPWPERARKAALVLEDAEQAVEDLCVELLGGHPTGLRAQKAPDKKKPVLGRAAMALLAKTDRPWIEGVATVAHSMSGAWPSC